MYDFVACQSFGGGFDVGMTMAGLRLVHKVEQVGGFGMANCQANRHILGDIWYGEVGHPDTWTPVRGDVVISNPPCSGWSLLSNSSFRGINSPANDCMWVTERYVAQCMPYIALFESVQGAFTAGLPLMRLLRAKLEMDTGHKWTLHHVLHNNMSIGGASIRKRYFWCVSRIPFGIEMPKIDRVPDVHAVIGDLEGMADTWAAQPYRRLAGWWSKSRRRPDGVVDGHKARWSIGNRRALELIPGAGWEGREAISDVARRHWATHGKMPPLWSEKQVTRLVLNGWQMGFHQASRWSSDQFCRVLTGGAAWAVVHPTEDRFLTQREIARVQGFPDDWRIWPLRGLVNLDATWGKGVPADVGRWIGGWIIQALDGSPGSYAGEPFGEREFKIDCTNSYKDVIGVR